MLLEAESFMSDMELWSWLLIIRESHDTFFWGIQGNKVQHPSEIPVLVITLYPSFFPIKLQLGKRVHLLFNSYKEKNANPTALMLLKGRDVVLLIKKRLCKVPTVALWGSVGQMWSIVFNQKNYFFCNTVIYFLSKPACIYHSNTKQQK